MDFLGTARRQMLAGQVNDARERLLSSFDGLTEDEMKEPGVKNEWSVRDILANIAAWDRATTLCFKDMLEGKRHPLLDMTDQDVEQFEHENYLANEQRPVPEVVEELKAAREELVELLKGVSNAQMFAPAPGDEHADMSIAACLAVTVDLDEENAEFIEQWREANGR